MQDIGTMPAAVHQALMSAIDIGGLGKVLAGCDVAYACTAYPVEW
jgi:hypothetical protein